MKVKSLSHVQLFATPWTVAYQAPPSMGFSRQEYWSGLPFPSPGDLPDPEIEPGSSHIVGRRFTVWATREEEPACHRCSLNGWVKYSSIWERQKGVGQDYKNENPALRLLCKHLCFCLPSQSVLEKTTPEIVDGDCVKSVAIPDQIHTLGKCLGPALEDTFIHHSADLTESL